jgi:hypothetical protein
MLPACSPRVEPRDIARVSVLLCVGALAVGLAVALIGFGWRSGNGAVVGGLAILAGLAVLGAGLFFVGGAGVDALWLRLEKRKERQR